MESRVKIIKNESGWENAMSSSQRRYLVVHVHQARSFATPRHTFYPCPYLRAHVLLESLNSEDTSCIFEKLCLASIFDTSQTYPPAEAFRSQSR